MIALTPMTTVGEIAELLEANKGRDVETYVRIETIRGRPVAYLVREPRMPAQVCALSQRHTG